ncbi:BadF-type ATPase [Friedmanniella luteola]|uniref:BadF-type ATPase n=1 Tax=Friedmanniella luteola TaxID=546871 RepID=A0A1H1V8E8_9ACTN|nr:BadF/BadG/BcrA/BcrD ATPase family protein [Friedmanniella luteola]SDS81012.1 BadF-type ATPase [Friedmanniella luteola]
MTELVVGADVGGTSTRVAVADLDGHVLAVAAGGPGNPNLVGTAGSAAEIRATVRRALQDLPGPVRGVVIGLAGGSRAAGDPAFLPAAVPGPSGVPAALVSDLAVGFSSATSAAEGCMVIAGTGAVAGRISGDDLHRRRDGWGYLLGDRGSGFWLGRAAVRSTLAALDEERPLSALHTAVLADADAEDYLGLVEASYAHPPTWLARFAPLVSRHADDDPVAGAIADAAADLLAETLAGLDPRPGEPVVLGGSVLATPGPVRDRFAARVPPGLALLSAESGLVGATWIALRRLGRASEARHARLVATLATAPHR